MGERGEGSEKVHEPGLKLGMPMPTRLAVLMSIIYIYRKFESISANAFIWDFS